MRSQVSLDVRECNLDVNYDTLNCSTNTGMSFEDKIKAKKVSHLQYLRNKAHIVLPNT